MADWKKTKCCGTCALWNAERAKDARGRIHAHRPGECNWALSIPIPESVLHIAPPALKPTWMCRDYGTKCACYIKRIAP